MSDVDAKSKARPSPARTMIHGEMGKSIQSLKRELAHATNEHTEVVHENSLLKNKLARNAEDRKTLATELSKALSTQTAMEQSFKDLLAERRAFHNATVKDVTQTCAGLFRQCKELGNMSATLRMERDKAVRRLEELRAQVIGFSEMAEKAGDENKRRREKDIDWVAFAEKWLALIECARTEETEMAAAEEEEKRMMEELIEEEKEVETALANAKEQKNLDHDVERDVSDAFHQTAPTLQQQDGPRVMAAKLKLNEELNLSLDTKNLEPRVYEMGAG